MSERKSLRIQQPTGRRLERYKREDDTYTTAIARLLDQAGVPEVLVCAECGSDVQAHVRDAEDRILCFACADVDAPLEGQG